MIWSEGIINFVMVFMTSWPVAYPGKCQVFLYYRFMLKEWACAVVSFLKSLSSHRFALTLFGWCFFDFLNLMLGRESLIYCYFIYLFFFAENQCAYSWFWTKWWIEKCEHMWCKALNLNSLNWFNHLNIFPTSSLHLLCNYETWIVSIRL